MHRQGKTGTSRGIKLKARRNRFGHSASSVWVCIAVKGRANHRRTASRAEDRRACTASGRVAAQSCTVRRQGGCATVAAVATRICPPKCTERAHSNTEYSTVVLAFSPYDFRSRSRPVLLPSSWHPSLVAKSRLLPSLPLSTNNALLYIHVSFEFMVLPTFSQFLPPQVLSVVLQKS